MDALGLPLELLTILREEWPRTQPALGPLSSSSLAQYRSLLFDEPLAAHRHRYAALLLLAHEHITAQPYAAVPASARRFYSEVGLLWALSDCLTPAGRTQTDWEDAVGRLDRVLIIAGAPDRVDLVLALIEHVQQAHLPPLPATTPSAASDDDDEDAAAAPPFKRARRTSSGSTPPALSLAPTAIPRLAAPPSLSAYLKTLLDKPFILPGYLRATSWPAVVDPNRRWKDGNYLFRAGGRGRIVPVEIDAAGGGGYTDEGWGQALLPWDEFLRRAGFLRTSDASESASSHTDKPIETALADDQPSPPPLYLAQHDLFFQFPALARDILTPDYVYACPPSSPTSTYQPPATASGVVTNVWVGDAGRGSPAHTDPFYNCFAQVVGRKRVLLVPPAHHAAMYPYASSKDGADDDKKDQEEEGGAATALMSNTSRVPLLQSTPPSPASYPRFYTEALPDALEGVLEEGDLLVLPPGWWHAMRMEGGPGWGCSFWF